MRRLTRLDHHLNKSFEMLSEDDQEAIFEEMDQKGHNTLVEHAEAQPKEQEYHHRPGTRFVTVHDGPHWCVGKHWGGHSSKLDRTAIYLCEKWASDSGYWLVNIHDPTDRPCVSERAINATFWPAEDRGTYWYIVQWRVGVSKRDGKKYEPEALTTT